MISDKEFDDWQRRYDELYKELDNAHLELVLSQREFDDAKHRMTICTKDLTKAKADYDGKVKEMNEHLKKRSK